MSNQLLMFEEYAGVYDPLSLCFAEEDALVAHGL